MTDTLSVRLDGYYVCDCGHEMLFLEPRERGKLRRMACVNEDCPRKSIDYVEPVFPVERA